MESVMKNKKWIISLIVIVIILGIIIALSIFIYNKINIKHVDVKDKIKSELNYLETTTIAMINSLNNLNAESLIKSQNSQNSQTNTMSQNSSEGSSSQSSGSSKQSGSQGQSSSSGQQSNGESGGETPPSNVEKYSIKEDSVLLRDRNKVNWNKLEKQTEDLYNYWTTVTLDLNNIQVPNDKILEYNSNLDKLLISLKNKDKINSAICLANLYRLIPVYMENTSGNKDTIKLTSIKANVVSAYSVVESGDWDSVSKLLAKAEGDLSGFINSESSSKETRQSILNRSYVLLKELIKSCNDKDIDIFYLKYINLINELEKIK